MIEIWKFKSVVVLIRAGKGHLSAASTIRMPEDPEKVCRPPFFDNNNHSIETLNAQLYFERSEDNKHNNNGNRNTKTRRRNDTINNNNKMLESWRKKWLPEIGDDDMAKKRTHNKKKKKIQNKT